MYDSEKKAQRDDWQRAFVELLFQETCVVVLDIDQS